MPKDFKYTLTGEDDYAILTVIFPGEDPMSLRSDQSTFQKAVQKAIAGDPTVRDLFDVRNVVGTEFKRLGDRVQVAEGVVFYDGKPVDDSITQQIVNILENGDGDLAPLVKFFEKVQLNPCEHTRKQLYNHLRKHPDGYTITPDGDFVAYKGVERAGDGYQSVHSGKAIVDGKVIEGKVPNAVGSIIEMRREDVEHNPAKGCAPGLHVATHKYATGWGQEVFSVIVNPRDVVSVPNGEESKMRVCRYVVAAMESGKIEEPVLDPTEDAIEEAEANVNVTVTVTTDAVEPAPWWEKYFGKRKRNRRRR